MNAGQSNAGQLIALNLPGEAAAVAAGGGGR